MLFLNDVLLYIVFDTSVRKGLLGLNQSQARSDICVFAKFDCRHSGQEECIYFNAYKKEEIETILEDRLDTDYVRGKVTCRHLLLPFSSGLRAFLFTLRMGACDADRSTSPL